MHSWCESVIYKIKLIIEKSTKNVKGILLTASKFIVTNKIYGKISFYYLELNKYLRRILSIYTLKFKNN